MRTMVDQKVEFEAQIITLDYYYYYYVHLYCATSTMCNVSVKLNRRRNKDQVPLVEGLSEVVNF